MLEGGDSSKYFFNKKTSIRLSFDERAKAVPRLRLGAPIVGTQQSNVPSSNGVTLELYNQDDA